MDRSGVKTFNSAKKFAEEMLHPLMMKQNDAKVKSMLGAISNEEAMRLPVQIRVMNRFNAVKERITFQKGLLNEVEPTVRLNGRSSEIDLIDELNKQLLDIENNCENHSEELIEEVGGKPSLTPLFKDVCNYLDRIYVQLQKTMTKNKLLFFGSDNEFLDNEELMEKIKSENRRS